MGVGLEAGGCSMADALGESFRAVPDELLTMETGCLIMYLLLSLLNRA